LFLIVCASPAAGQVLRGTIVEQGTSTRIDGALITLLTEQGDSLAAVVSTRGTFTLPMPRVGRYRLRAQRLGYATTDTRTFDVGPAQEVTVTITLGVQGVLLEPLHVETRPVPISPWLAEVEERRRMGFGRFITRERLEELAGASAAELLRQIPGARVSTTVHGDPVVQLRARPILMHG
jgi:hypothetical protein